MIKFMRNAFLTAWLSEGHRKTLLQSSDDYCSQNRAWGFHRLGYSIYQATTLCSRERRVRTLGG